MTRPAPVLALAIDAADARLVKRLAAEGHLPSMARLIERGHWGGVRAGADIGSGAVWPTFTTGRPAAEHGVFGEHAWDAGAMRLRRPTFDRLDPFWRRLAAASKRVAVVDVPFAPVLRLAGLVEIADWGAHDWFGGAPVISPPEVVRALAGVVEPRHPLAAGPVDVEGPGDVEGLRHVVRSLVAGARQRGALAARLIESTRLDLAVVVFTEVHRASHLLWHTIDPAHPVWRGGLGGLPTDVMGGLVDVFREVDAQIGALLARAGDGVTAVVFALHGMQPTHGIPAILGDVLEAWGYARRRTWWQRSARELAGGAARGLKARVPAALKKAYYRRVPKSVTMQLAQSSMPVQPWDWPRTRAFALPTDQHGWVRINLEGREAEGSVSSRDYDAVCRELRDRLLGLASAEGPLVQDVCLTAEAASGPPAHLPDLVVHWTPRTCRPDLRLADPPITPTPLGLKFVGQHDHDGFYVGTGGGIEGWPGTVEATVMGSLLGRALGLP